MEEQAEPDIAKVPNMKYTCKSEVIEIYKCQNEIHKCQIIIEIYKCQTEIYIAKL